MNCILIFHFKFQEIYLGVGQSRTVDILFDPAYKDDAHIRIAEEQLTVSYKEHPHVVLVKNIYHLSKIFSLIH